MKTRLFGLLLAAFASFGCSTFSITPPADFVEREEREWSSYSYRALNADAVVLGVREVEEDKAASLAFWKKAVMNRLQASHSYALMGEEELAIASGQKVTLLRLGREDAGVQYDYWVGLIDVDENVFVIEAGGRREHFAKVRDSLLESIKGFEVTWWGAQ